METPEFKVGDVFQIDDGSIYIVSAIVNDGIGAYYRCGVIHEADPKYYGVLSQSFDVNRSGNNAYTLTYLTHCGGV